MPRERPKFKHNLFIQIPKTQMFYFWVTVQALKLFKTVLAPKGWGFFQCKCSKEVSQNQLLALTPHIKLFNFLAFIKKSEFQKMTGDTYRAAGGATLSPTVTTTVIPEVRIIFFFFLLPFLVIFEKFLVLLQNSRCFINQSFD